MGKVLYWLAFIPLCLVVIVFAVSNHATTELSLWPILTDPVPFPVYGIALIALFIGFLLGCVVSWFQGGHTRRRVRDLLRQSEKEQQEIAALRDRVSRLQVTEREATIPPAPVAAVTAAGVAAGTAPNVAGGGPAAAGLPRSDSASTTEAAGAPR